MKINQIVESATTAGSIATVESPLGTIQTRMQKPPKAPKVAKGKKYANTVSEGKGLADKIAGKLKKNVEKSNKEKKDTEEKVKQHQQDQKDKVSEAELSEADLIIVPAMRKIKDKSFIPHKEDRRDHEVEMARSDLLAAAKNAMRMYHLLKDRTEDEGLMGWQQSYITLATDYLQSVADNLEYDARTDEMTGGVLAGGMSNFEEGRYYDPMGDERREQQRYDDERTAFKHREQNAGVENEPNNYAVAIDGRTWKVFGDKRQAENIARSLRNKGKKAEVYATGASVSEEKQGLWANIHAKRERIKKGSGERMRKPGSKGAPTAQAFKQSQKTSKK